MSLNFRDDLIKASEKHFEAHIEKHRINVEILLENQVKIVSVGDKGYIVLGVVSVNTSFSTEELKSQWRLADTILQKNNEWYICMEIIDTEFFDI